MKCHIEQYRNEKLLQYGGGIFELVKECKCRAIISYNVNILIKKVKKKIEYNSFNQNHPSKDEQSQLVTLCILFECV